MIYQSPAFDWVSSPVRWPAFFSLWRMGFMRLVSQTSESSIRFAKFFGLSFLQFSGIKAWDVCLAKENFALAFLTCSLLRQSIGHRQTTVIWCSPYFQRSNKILRPSGQVTFFSGEERESFLRQSLLNGREAAPDFCWSAPSGRAIRGINTMQSQNPT